MNYLAILAIALLTSTLGPSAPDNYCTTVAVVAEAGSTFAVDAVGAGRYARVYDLTDDQVVVTTDFGLGATEYHWTGLNLVGSHLYQVQVSHTSLYSGFSNAGCEFCPPAALAVSLEYLTAEPHGDGILVSWGVADELTTAWYEVWRGTPDTTTGTKLAAIMASAGSQLPADYTYLDTPPTMLTRLFYTLRVYDIDGTHEDFVALVAQARNEKAPRVAEIENFQYDACEDVFSWDTTHEIINYAYRVIDGTQWQSPLVMGQAYPSIFGSHYEVGRASCVTPENPVLCVYLDTGFTVCEDYADLVCGG